MLVSAQGDQLLSEAQLSRVVLNHPVLQLPFGHWRSPQASLNPRDSMSAQLSLVPEPARKVAIRPCARQTQLTTGTPC